MKIGSIERWVLLVAGLGWISFALDGGVLRALTAGLVGTVGAGMGVAALLLPGDRRIPAHAALAFVAGVLVAFVCSPGFGFVTSIGLGALAAAGALAAGRMSLAQTAPTPGVPAWEMSLPLVAKVALDEAVLGSFHLRIRFPRGEGLKRIIEETLELRARHEASGFLEKPDAYHSAPLPLETPRIALRSLFGIGYEHLSFDSEWEPASDAPGRERWLRGTANRTAHAYVVRGNADAPWLIAINGYRMGLPLTDLALFDPRYYHQRLGLNLLIPVLPLHGPRRTGRLSGDGYLDADPVAFTLAESQAIWDIRRLIGWVRKQGASRIGAMGLSLGGYNAALLASVEDGLDCVIAGVPVADFGRILSWHAPPALQREFEAHGLDAVGLSEALRPVSPLALAPRVPLAARAVFGGVADRIAPPDHQRDLIAHWGTPRHAWYQGGHLSFRLDRGVRSLIHEVLVGHLGARDAAHPGPGSGSP